MNYELNRATFLFFVFFVLLSLCVPFDKLYAFNWKQLHEQADSLTSVSAQEIVAKKGQAPENLYLLALTYLNEHKDKEAQEIFTQLAGYDKANPAYAWGLAEVLRRKHDAERSRKILKTLIQENHGFAPAYITLAYIKYREMDFSQCVKLASQVLALGRENVDLSNFVRAYLLISGGKGMLAYYGGPLSKVINGTATLPNLKKAEKLQPKSAEVLFGLGSFYFLAPSFVGGDSDKAIGYLERAVKADPLFADAYVRLAQAYNMKGDTKKYEEYMAYAFKIDPQNALALDAKTGACKFICKGPENK